MTREDESMEPGAGRLLGNYESLCMAADSVSTRIGELESTLGSLDSDIDRAEAMGMDPVEVGNMCKCRNSLDNTILDLQVELNRLEGLILSARREMLLRE